MTDMDIMWDLYRNKKIISLFLSAEMNVGARRLMMIRCRGLKYAMSDREKSKENGKRRHTCSAITKGHKYHLIVLLD